MVRMWDKLVLMVAALLMMSLKVDSSSTVMKDMTKNFLRAFEECQKELNLSEETGRDLAFFWREDYVINNRDVGCAIMCLSKKLDMIEPDGSLHKGNAAEFVKKHGGDDEAAKTIVEVLHGCENAATPNDDHCLVALQISMCFKTEIHKLKWAPDPQLLLEELMAERAK